MPKLTYCWKLNFGLANSLSQNYLIASSFVVLASGLGGLNGAFGVMAGMFCVLLWQNARLSSQINQINQTRCKAEQKLRELEHHFYQVFDQAPDVGEVQEVILVTKDVTDRQQSEAALQQQAIVISVQQEIARKSLKKDEVMRLIVDRVQELTHAAGSVIEMMEGDELVYCEASGAAAAYVGLRLKVAASLSGQCISTGEIICCTDTETDPRVDIAACRCVGVRSMVVVPLLQEGGTLGVLKGVFKCS